MKNLFFIILNAFACINCNAQIYDLYDMETDHGKANGAYYKDINGFRDKFVGTWIFQNETMSLTLMFQKRNNLIRNNGITLFYQDLLIGEYKYIVNGIEKINTLTNINNDFGNNYYQNRDNHNIIGWMDLPSTLNPQCIECLANEKRLEMTLNEPNYDGMGIASNSFVLRHFVENGIEKLKVWFVNENQMYIVDDAGNAISPVPYKLPFGEYVLVKQN